MPATLTQKTILDGLGAAFQINAWDASGVGSGPFVPLSALACNGAPVPNAGSDGIAAANVPLTGEGLFNGATFDLQRGNTQSGALQTLSAASAGVNGADQTNVNSKGLHLIIDVTAITGTTPTLTVTLQGKDPTSGKYYPILASAALAAVSTTVLRVYPGLTASANLTANDILPRTWRIVTAIGGTTPAVTATIAANLVI